LKAKLAISNQFAYLVAAVLGDCVWRSSRYSRCITEGKKLHECQWQKKKQKFVSQHSEDRCFFRHDDCN